MTTVLVTLLTVVVALLVVLVVGLLRTNARILRALHDMGIDLESHAARGPASGVAVVADGPAARVAGGITGTTPDGGPISIATVGTAAPTVLAFLTSTCAECIDVWHALAEPRRARMLGDARPVVVTKGDEAESRDRVRRLAPPGVPVVMSTDAWAAYGVDVAPRVMCLDPGAGTVVRDRAVSTWDDVLAACRTGAGTP